VNLLKDQRTLRGLGEGRGLITQKEARQGSENALPAGRGWRQRTREHAAGSGEGRSTSAIARAFVGSLSHRPGPVGCLVGAPVRHIFYALLGGYFVAGLLIGLNWLIAIDSEQTAVQQAEHVHAAVQSTRTQGAESANVNDIIIGQALTSKKKSSDNGEASLSPHPAAARQPPQTDPKTASLPGRDTGTLGPGRPQGLGACKLDKEAGPCQQFGLLIRPFHSQRRIRPDQSPSRERPGPLRLTLARCQR
jgi:hypothetical protein